MLASCARKLLGIQSHPRISMTDSENRVSVAELTSSGEGGSPSASPSIPIGVEHLRGQSNFANSYLYNAFLVQLVYFPILVEKKPRPFEYRSCRLWFYKNIQQLTNWTLPLHYRIN